MNHNLHSNMVRFSRVKKGDDNTQLANLHSNMVRFSPRCLKLATSISLIYIPIWLDFRINLRHVSALIVKFTFQYG